MHSILVKRIHDRTITCLRLLLQGNQCAELPKVDVHFDRKKIQAQDARGNIHNNHGGFNTKNMPCSDLRKISCCDPNYLFTDDFKSTYPQLLRLGLVICYRIQYHEIKARHSYQTLVICSQ